MLRKRSNHVSKRGLRLDQEGHWTGDFIITGCNGGSRHDSLQIWQTVMMLSACDLSVGIMYLWKSYYTYAAYVYSNVQTFSKPSFEAYCKFSAFIVNQLLFTSPDNKVHGANMGPTWVLSAPDGPHVGPMNLAIREGALLRRHIS